VLRLEDARDSQHLAREARRAVQAGKSLRARRLYLDASLDDSQVGCLEIQIPGGGAILEAVEFRVVKLLPPKRGGGVVGGGARLSGLGRSRRRRRRLNTLILRGDRLVRCLEIRTHRFAGEERAGDRTHHEDLRATHQWAPGRPPAFFTGEKSNVNGTNANASTAQYRNTSM
jgi:hypothetical protein